MAYKEGANAIDVVAKTKEIKKRHRMPLIPKPQKKGGYRRDRVVSRGRSEGEIHFDQDDFGRRLYGLMVKGWRIPSRG